MRYEYVAIPDEDVPVAMYPAFRQLVSTYAGETNKTVSMWGAVPDDLLDTEVQPWLGLAGAPLVPPIY